ncbi:hypothetical protein AB0H49_12360 [Nocardia sp. NPDC050713]|uniref:hypothetical protein n=1 Tax=Nocardia sp. NPDC050713 TaxID=3154511 RepID=UPI0033DB2270
MSFGTRLRLAARLLPVSGPGLPFGALLRTAFRLRTGPRPFAVLGLGAVPSLCAGSRLSPASLLGTGPGLPFGIRLRAASEVSSGPQVRAVLGLGSGTRRVRLRQVLRPIPGVRSGSGRSFGAQRSGLALRAVPGLRSRSGARPWSGVGRGGRRPDRFVAARIRNLVSRNGLGFQIRTRQCFDATEPTAPEEPVNRRTTRHHRRRQHRNSRRRRTVRLDVQPVHIVARLVLSRVALLRRDRTPASRSHIRYSRLELRGRARRRRDRLRLPPQRRPEFPQSAEEVADTAHRSIGRRTFPPLVDRPL